jgi:hypothetical protein
MRRWVALPAAFLFALSGAAWAQDEEEGEDEDQLTPEQAMEMLKDIHGLMAKAEDLLNDGSRGKALETEQELLKKLEREFKDEPAALQRQILEKVKKLTQRSEKKQKDAIDKMQELIKKARSCGGGNSKGDKQQEQKQNQSQAQKQPSGPAQTPYNPNRTDPPSKFRSNADRTGQWGNLPPRMREQMMHGKRDIDDYPAELQQVLSEYMKRIMQGE